MFSLSVVRSLPSKGSSSVVLLSVAKEMPSASSLSYRTLLFGSMLGGEENTSKVLGDFPAFLLLLRLPSAVQWLIRWDVAWDKRLAVDMLF